MDKKQKQHVRLIIESVVVVLVITYCFYRNWWAAFLLSQYSISFSVYILFLKVSPKLSILSFILLISIMSVPVKIFTFISFQN